MNLYQQCEELFRRYPLAVDPLVTPTSDQMILTMGNRPRPDIYILMLGHPTNRSPYCSLRAWDDTRDLIVDESGTVEERGGITVQQAHKILNVAIPIPRDGSLFAWVARRAVTALVPVYTWSDDPDVPPSYSVMPRTDVLQRDWPPFTAEPVLGPWFWEHHSAGRLIEIGSHIARTSGEIYWADTKAALGSDCAAVASDVKLPHDVTLARGMYAYYQNLRDGAAPSLDTLLARRDLTDLGPRFAQVA